jgi:hypothetical protein
MTRVLIALLALAALVMILGGSDCSPAGLLLGDVVDAELARVNDIVHSAGQQGQGIVAQSGMEVANAIQGFKAAYDDSMNKTVDKLDQAGTEKLEEIKGLVNTLETGSDAAIKNAGIEALTIVNTLPGSKGIPQLKRYSPMFVATSTGPGQILIKVEGNFPALVKDEFKPSLNIAGKDYPAFGASTFALQFVVPAEGVTKSASNKIGLTAARLKVPYEVSKFFGLIKKRREGSFLLLIGTLPPNPGRLLLTRTYPQNPSTTTNVPVIEHVTTATFYQDSQIDHVDRVEKEHEGPPLPPDVTIAGVGYPWHVIEKSIRFVDEWHQGKEGVSWAKGYLHPEPVSFWVTTLWKVAYADGIVRWHYTYDIQRDNPVVVPGETPPATEEVLDMVWGQSMTIPGEQGSWRLTLEPFDGPIEETTGFMDQRFLRVEQVGKEVRITVKRASEVDYLPEQVVVN